MAMSDKERLIRNFFSSRDDFLPKSSTNSTIIFPKNENIAVSE